VPNRRTAGPLYEQFVTPFTSIFLEAEPLGQALLGAEIVLHVLTFNQRVTPR
jgi:hypothetical protein